MSCIFSFLKKLRKTLDKWICSIVEITIGHTDEGPTDEEIENLIEEADDYGWNADYYEARSRAEGKPGTYADCAGGARRHDDD